MYLRDSLKYLSISMAGTLLTSCHPAAAVEGRVGPISRLDCLLVERATIVQSPRGEGIFGLANALHQIGPGSHTVLVIRAYEDPGPIDGQLFWKATLEFAAVPRSLPPGQTQKVSVVRSYYSDGASGWVANGEYVWSANPFRSFDMTRADDSIAIRLHATFNTIHADSGKTRSATVAWTCPVSKLTAGQLDPWEGKIGTSWDSFYPDTIPRSVKRPVR